MSELVGETYVTITPLVNEAEFKAKAEPQINRAVQGIKVDFPPINPPDLTKLREQLRAAAGSFRQAGGTGDEQLFGAVQTQVQSIRKEVEGLGTGAVQALAGEFEQVAAAEGTARAEMTRFITTLEQAKAETIRLAAEEKERAAQQRRAARLAATETVEQIGLERERAALQSQTLRGQLRNVLDGRAPVSSILSPRALVGFAAGGVAIGAVFQGLQHLSEALKVTGDEAFTTEGRFRNFGAELLSGDVVGGFIALNAHMKTSSEQLKELQKDTKTSYDEFVIFSEKTAASATTLEALDGAMQKVGDNSAFAHAIEKAADDTREAADAARDYAAGLLAAEQAAQSLAATIAHAGSEAAQFGEQVRGAGSVAASTPLIPRGDPGGSTDTTGTTANQFAIREANADTLQEQLRVALDERRQVEKDIKRANELGGEGVVALQVELAQRRRQIRDIRAGIVSAARAADEKEKADAKAAADKAERDAKEAADAAAKAIRDALSFREGTLQGALEAAQAGTLAQQRKALLALISFHKAESVNRDLDKAERQKALLAAQGYRRELNALNREALADALGVREQNLQNAIVAAKLTPGTGDDDRADRAFLKYLQNQVKRAKGNALAVAQAQGELLNFKLSLKDKAKSDGGSSFTLQDLFQEAVDQFETFGSNIAPRGGILTPQDARASLGGRIASDLAMAVRQSQLTEAQRQTALLSEISTKLSPEEHGKGRIPALVAGSPGMPVGRYAAKLAADQGYVVP